MIKESAKVLKKIIYFFPTGITFYFYKLDSNHLVMRCKNRDQLMILILFLVEYY